MADVSETLTNRNSSTHLSHLRGVGVFNVFKTDFGIIFGQNRPSEIAEDVLMIQNAVGTWNHP